MESSGGTRATNITETLKNPAIFEVKRLDASGQNLAFTLDDGGDTESEYSTFKNTFGTFGKSTSQFKGSIKDKNPHARRIEGDSSSDDNLDPANDDFKGRRTLDFEDAGVVYAKKVSEENDPNQDTIKEGTPAFG